MNETTTPLSGSNDGNDDEKDHKKQGRGRGNYKGKRGQKTTHVRKTDLPTKEKFVGRSDDLEGYIYSIVSSKRAEFNSPAPQRKSPDTPATSIPQSDLISVQRSSQ
jgi:hypothetical protein